MTAATIGRHSAGRDGLVPFVDRRRAIRSHRRPGTIRTLLGQLARTIRERIEHMSSMMPEGRWLPGTLIPEYRPESEGFPPAPTPSPIPAHPDWCVCGHVGCPGTPPAPAVDGPTVQLDPFTVRPYVLDTLARQGSRQA